MTTTSTSRVTSAATATAATAAANANEFVRRFDAGEVVWVDDVAVPA